MLDLNNGDQSLHDCAQREHEKQHSSNFDQLLTAHWKKSDLVLDKIIECAESFQVRDCKCSACEKFRLILSIAKSGKAIRITTDSVSVLSGVAGSVGDGKVKP